MLHDFYPCREVCDCVLLYKFPCDFLHNIHLPTLQKKQSTALPLWTCHSLASQGFNFDVDDKGLQDMHRKSLLQLTRCSMSDSRIWVDTRALSFYFLLLSHTIVPVLLYTVDKGMRAETSCNQLLYIDSATYLLNIKSPYINNAAMSLYAIMPEVTSSLARNCLLTIIPLPAYVVVPFYH